MEKKEKELLEQKKKVEEYSRELKTLSNEELDQVAGGVTTTTCPKGCTYYPLHNKCICPDD